MKVTFIHFQTENASVVLERLEKRLISDFKMKLVNFTAAWKSNSSTLEIKNDSTEHLVFILKGKTFWEAPTTEELASVLPSSYSKKIELFVSSFESEEGYSLVKTYLPDNIISPKVEVVRVSNMWEEF